MIFLRTFKSAVGHLISKSIELHDNSKFNVYGFYFGRKLTRRSILFKVKESFP